MSRDVDSVGKMKRLLSLPLEKKRNVLRVAAAKALNDYQSSEVNLGDLVQDVIDYLA